MEEKENQEFDQTVQTPIVNIDEGNDPKEVNNDEEINDSVINDVISDMDTPNTESTEPATEMPVSEEAVNIPSSEETIMPPVNSEDSVENNNVNVVGETPVAEPTIDSQIENAPVDKGVNTMEGQESVVPTPESVQEPVVSAAPAEEAVPVAGPTPTGEAQDALTPPAAQVTVPEATAATTPEAPATPEQPVAPATEQKPEKKNNMLFIILGAVVLVIVVVLILVLVVFKKPEETEKPADNTPTNTTPEPVEQQVTTDILVVYVDGNKLTFPANKDTLSGITWEIDPGFGESEVQAFEIARQGKVTSSNGTMYIDVINNSEEAKQAQECEIVNVLFKSEENTENDIKFEGDITLKSTKDEVKSAMTTLGYNDPKEDEVDGHGTLAFFKDNNQANAEEYIEFVFDGDNIYSVGIYKNGVN